MDQTTPEGEVSNGITEDQAVAQILGRWGVTDEPKAEPAQEEPQEEAQAEQPVEGDAPVSEEPSEEPEQEDEAEIDVAGEKFKVPAQFKDTAQRIQAKAKEVEAGATRKFQEAAELRKSAETQLEAVKQLQKLASAQADLLADHKMVAKRLQQLESIDIQSTDSDTLTRLNAEYNQLQAASRRIEAQLAKSHEEMTAEESKAVQAKIAHANEVLKTRVKGWGPEKAKSLTEYAISRGAPPEALAGITDAWMVEILEDAAYGRQMREHKSTVDKRIVQTPKTLKPGASGKTTAPVAKAEQAMKRVQQTGDIRDAAAALLLRSAAKRNR